MDPHQAGIYGAYCKASRRYPICLLRTRNFPVWHTSVSEGLASTVMESLASATLLCRQTQYREQGELSGCKEVPSLTQEVQGHHCA